MIPDFMNPVKFLVRSSFKLYKKSTVTCLQYKVLTQISNSVWGVENISTVQILGNALKPQIFASKTVKRQMLKLLRFFQWGLYSQINPSGPHKIWLNSFKIKDDPDICCSVTPDQVQFCLKSQNHRLSWVGRDPPGSLSPTPDPAQDTPRIIMCLRDSFCNMQVNLNDWRRFSIDLRDQRTEILVVQFQRIILF